LPTTLAIGGVIDRGVAVAGGEEFLDLFRDGIPPMRGQEL